MEEFPEGRISEVPRGIPTPGIWELYKAPISIESDPMLTSSVSLPEERYTSINQKIGKTYLFIGGLCSFPFLGWYCWSNLKTGSRHCFLCQESRCRWKLCSGTLFSLLPFSSMIFFSLGDDRDAEEVKFVHGTLTGGGELESTSSGPHLWKLGVWTLGTKYSCKSTGIMG